MAGKKAGLLDKIANLMYSGDTRTPLRYDMYGLHEADDPNSEKFRRKNFKPPNDIDELRTKLKGIVGRKSVK